MKRLHGLQTDSKMEKKSVESSFEICVITEQKIFFQSSVKKLDILNYFLYLNS
jgi:hypothetical protein